MRCRGWRSMRRPGASANKASLWCHAMGHSEGVCCFLYCMVPLCARGFTLRPGRWKLREKE